MYFRAIRCRECIFEFIGRFSFSFYLLIDIKNVPYWKPNNLFLLDKKFIQSKNVEN